MGKCNFHGLRFCVFTIVTMFRVISLIIEEGRGKEVPGEGRGGQNKTAREFDHLRLVT